MLSNSLNYTIKLSNIFNIKDITRSKVCPLMSLSRDYNPFRYLLFLKQDNYFIDLYYTDTKDFADTEIFEIKFRFSQIYKQISKNEYINDFSIVPPFLLRKAEMPSGNQNRLSEIY